MEREIKTTLSVDGTERFIRNLKSVDSELKVLGKELGTLTSKYAENTKSATSLAAQQANLQKQVSLNKQKTDALKAAVDTQRQAYDKEEKELQRLIKAHGMESKEVIEQAKVVRSAEIELDNYRKKLADSEKALQKSSYELKRFNEENGKTKVGQTFTAGKAAIDDFKKRVSEATEKFKPLTSAAKNVAKAAGEITFKAAKASAEAFAKTTEKAMSASLNAVKSYTKALVGAATTISTAAAAGVTAITKSAVDQFGNYEQLVGGVETLFKDSSSKVEKYANDAYKSAGLSANDYMETVTAFSASLLQSLGGDTDKAADKADMAIRDMSDNANKMGSDMQTIQNAYQGFAKGNYTMLDNLKLGYGGTKTEMERLLADAQKISGIKYDISSYSDVIDAIHVMQTEMGITGTTQKEAEKTIQGSTAAMKSAYNNLMAGIATDGADIEKLVNDLINSIETVVNNVIPVVERALKGVGKAISVGIPIIIKKIPPLVAKILPDLIKTVGGLINQLSAYLGKTMPQFTKTVLPEAVKQIQSILPTLLNKLTTGFNSILLNLADMVVTTLPVVTQTILPAMIQGTTDLVVGMVGKLPELLHEVTAGAITLFQGLIDGLNTVMDELLPMLPQMVADITQQLFSSIPQLFDGALELFGKLLEALNKTIQEIMPQLPQFITDMCKTLTDHIDEIIDTGFDLLIGLIDGFTAAMPTIMEELPKIVVKIAKKLTEPDNLGRLLQSGTELIRAVAKGFPGAIKYIAENIPAIINNIIDSLMSVDWLGLGIDIVKGILEGFLNVGDIIWDYVSSFKDEMLDTIENVFEIFSPSHIMRDEVGKYLGLGVVTGFVGAMEKGTEEMANSIPKEFDTDVKLNTAADLSYLRGYNGQAAGDVVYNIPVTVNFNGNLDSSRNYREIAEGIAQETQYQLANLGLRA